MGETMGGTGACGGGPLTVAWSELRPSCQGEREGGVVGRVKKANTKSKRLIHKVSPPILHKLGQEGGKKGGRWVETKVSSELGATKGRARGKEMVVVVVGGMGLIDGGKEREAGRVRGEAGRLGRGSRCAYFSYSLSKL